jgi:glycosyltransferase involved in cell wall biosynthesis
MKIVVVGTRGIPDVLGGVETHCQELYPRLASKGIDITVVTRTPYVPKKLRKPSYGNIALKHIFAPRIKSIEAIIHTFLALLYAKLHGANIVHIHAIGPALLTRFAKLLGLRIVLTHHGPDYDRQKWGGLAKRILRLGEAVGANNADEVIVISQVIANILKTNYGRHDTHLIHNGVSAPVLSSDTDYLDELGLAKNNYCIAVGRFVEEKGFHDLIEAWKLLKNTTSHLVIVGDADHETAYSQQLKKSAHSAGIVLTGFIKGEKLNQIYTHARMFIMPSYHEGLPIALLEAMSYSLPVIVSDIPANVEINLPKSCYFETGNIKLLAESIENTLANSKHDYSDYLKKYSWEKNADHTLNIYRQLLQKNK